MYYALGVASCEEAEEFCTINRALRTTHQYFFSGPEETRYWFLDIMFGIIVVVVLLNVLIAIVSGSWADSKRRAGVTFWAYRINFLFDVRSLPFAYEGRSTLPLFEQIDELGEYCSSGSEVWNWSDEWDYAENFCSHVYYGLKISVAFLVYYLLVIIIGPASFGLLWPRRIREYIFRHATTEDEMTKIVNGVDSIQQALANATPRDNTMNIKKEPDTSAVVTSRLDKIEQQQRQLHQKLDQILMLLAVSNE